jgi:GNAT superfamily N-acetyltransferase
VSEIRPFRPEDAEAAMALFRDILPEVVATPVGLVHWIANQPARAAVRVWTAFAGDELVGWGDGHLRWSIEANDVGEVWVAVRPDHRGRTLGGQLYALAENHVESAGAHRVETSVRDDDPASRQFAEKRGFVERRTERYWTLDLRNRAAGPPTARDEVRVVRLGELRDRERDLFELFDSAHRDMPSDHRHVLEFDEWRKEILLNPDLDLDLSSVVLAGERPVAFAWMSSDRGGRRAAHEMTGTHPEFRRRGLARLAKEAAIAWSAEAGIETLLTSNDSTNADMLALNDHLGYRPTHTRIGLSKTL